MKKKRRNFPGQGEAPPDKREKTRPERSESKKNGKWGYKPAKNSALNTSWRKM